MPNEDPPRWCVSCFADRSSCYDKSPPVKPEKALKTSPSGKNQTLEATEGSASRANSTSQTNRLPPGGVLPTAEASHDE